MNESRDTFFSNFTAINEHLRQLNIFEPMMSYEFTDNRYDDKHESGNFTSSSLII